MHILRANLKHLYQKRSYWFLGLVYGVFAFLVIKVITDAITKSKPGGFSAPILWMLFISFFIAILPINVLTKPFSYCLPNHRNIPRKFLFSIGLALSFLWSLSFAFYPGLLDLFETIIVCFSAFSVLTISYWLGAWFVFKFRNWSIVFATLPLIMLGNQLLNLSTVVVYTIVERPVPIILLGGMANYLAWCYWGRADLSRQYCGKMWMGAFDAWNTEKMAKYKQARASEKMKKKPDSMMVSVGVERFFISKISQAEIGSLQQYIWGALYKSFAIIISQQWQDWMSSLVLMPPILCFLCYMPGGGKNIIFVMPGLMLVQMSLWVHSSLSVCGGRRQRFWSAITLAVTTGIFVTVVVALLAMATQLLEGVMPELTVKGHEFAFKALDLKFSIVPLMMVPVTLAISLIFHRKPMFLIFHRKPMLKIVLVIGLFQIIFALVIFSTRSMPNRHVQVNASLAYMLFAMVFAWALFIGVLRFITTRCCLIGKVS